MSRTAFVAAALVVAASAATVGVSAQQAAPQTPLVGNPIGMPIVPDGRTPFQPASPNVKVFGSVYSAESCSYDPVRGVIVVPNRGVAQNLQTNNAWITFLNHDGSVHTSRWLGIQSPAERAQATPPWTLNEPLGSHVNQNVLYVADRDGGTSPTDRQIAVVRRFNIQTGVPMGETRVEASTGFNDLEAANDGTVYATQTGTPQDPSTWQVWKITREGAASILIQGAPLRQPNGIAIDAQGNLVVVNIGNADVQTFSPAGALLKTEQAVQPGNDGIVVMPDGTKYVSSVMNGGVSRIRPGRPAELIASNVPSAASMCYDSGANQLVIPLNANNALAFISLK